MEYIEVGICFVVGLAVVLLVAFSLRIKKRGLWLVVLNSLVGGGFMVILSVSRLLYMPVSPLSMAICGVFGVPGFLLILILTLFM